MSWNLVKHAFVMVFGNLSEAIKASVVPLAIGIVAMIGILNVAGIPFGVFMDQRAVEQMGPSMVAAYVPAFFLIAIIMMFIGAWVAVTWHRFILLEEYPTYLPPISGRLILNYIGKTILIALVLVVVAIPLSFVAGLVAAPLMMGGMESGGGGVMTGGILIGLLLGMILGWLWFRFAIALPGTAVGKPLNLREAWAATKPLSSTIFMMSLILVVINIGVSLLISPIMNGMPLIGAIINLAVTWATTMVGISALTTIYGHVVEGRELV